MSTMRRADGSHACSVTSALLRDRIYLVLLPTNSLLRLRMELITCCSSGREWLPLRLQRSVVIW